jgi:hypothetical protein
MQLIVVGGSVSPASSAQPGAMTQGTGTQEPRHSNASFKASWPGIGDQS